MKGGKGRLYLDPDIGHVETGPAKLEEVLGHTLVFIDLGVVNEASITVVVSTRDSDGDHAVVRSHYCYDTISTVSRYVLCLWHLFPYFSLSFFLSFFPPGF